MAVYENYEKYDMLVCVIQSNENLQEASELYLKVPYFERYMVRIIA